MFYMFDMRQIFGGPREVSEFIIYYVVKLSTGDEKLANKAVHLTRV